MTNETATLVGGRLPPLKQPSMFHIQVWCDDSCGGNVWPEKSAGHRLTLAIMISAVKVMQPKPCNSDTKNQCDVISASSPESRWIAGIEINSDPVWKGNLPLWWLGHTTALLDRHEWLTARLQTHGPSYTSQLFKYICEKCSNSSSRAQTFPVIFCSLNTDTTSLYWSITVLFVINT